MEQMQEIEEFERFPLRYAYPFLREKGFDSEVDKISQSKDSYKSYVSTLRRGKVIKLLEANHLLDEFINKCWPFGNTDKGQKQIARCKRVYDSWSRLQPPPPPAVKPITSLQKAVESDMAKGLSVEETRLLISFMNDYKKLMEENSELVRYKNEFEKYQRLEYIFEDERFMEDWLARNINKAIANIEIIDRQPTVTWNESFMKNRPDFFCLDKTTRELVVIENKVRGRHRRVETQYLTYRAWVNKNLDEINQKYKEKNLKATKDSKFVIITDTTDERLQAVCEDSKIALIVIKGGIYFEELVPFYQD